jgi:zeaxanthin glucosyltransferase
LRRAILVCFKARGHIYAATALARDLARLGFEVIFVGAPSAKPVFDELGHDFISLDCLDLLAQPFGIERRPTRISGPNIVAALIGLVRKGRAEVAGFEQSFGRIRSEMNGLIDATEPDLVIFDPFLLIYSLPVQARNIPVVSMSSMILATPDPLVPPFTEYLFPGMPFYRLRVAFACLRLRIRYGLWQRWERALGGASLSDLVAHFGEACGVDAKSNWRPRPVLFDGRFDNCAEWVLHAREFELPRSRKADHEVHFVGPLVQLDREERKAELPANGRPVVFASLSTVRNADPRLRRRILDEWLRLAANRRDVFFAISADDHAQALASQAIPENVKLFAFAPSIAILRQSSVLIAQAGDNVVKEAIWNDVPLLMLPLRADQPGVAARVVFHGLGLSHRKLPSWPRLSVDIDRLLNEPVWKERVVAMRKTFEGYDDLRALDAAVQAALRSRLEG